MKKLTFLKNYMHIIIICSIFLFTVFPVNSQHPVIINTDEFEGIKVTLTCLKNSVKPKESFHIYVYFENSSSTNNEHFEISNFKMLINFDHSNFYLKNKPRFSSFTKSSQKNSVDIGRVKNGFEINYYARKENFLIFPEGKNEFVEFEFSVKEDALPQNSSFYAEISNLNKKNFHFESEHLEIEILENKKQKAKKEKQKKENDKKKYTKKSYKKQNKDEIKNETTPEDTNSSSNSDEKINNPGQAQENLNTEQNSSFKIYLAVTLVLFVLGILSYFGFKNFYKNKRFKVK